MFSQMENVQRHSWVKMSKQQHSKLIKLDYEYSNDFVLLAARRQFVEKLDFCYKTSVKFSNIFNIPMRIVTDSSSSEYISKKNSFIR